MKISKLFLLNFFLLKFFFNLDCFGQIGIPDKDLMLDQYIQLTTPTDHPVFDELEFAPQEPEYNSDIEEEDLDEIMITNNSNDEWMIDSIEIIRIARKYTFQVKNKDFEYLARRDIQKFVEIYNIIVNLNSEIQRQINVTLSPDFFSEEFIEDHHIQESFEEIIKLLHQEHRSFIQRLIQLQEITAERQAYKRIKQISSPRVRRNTTKEYNKQKHIRIRARRARSAQHYSQEDFCC